MRLLNTSTLKLVEFYGEIPPYAILSHTWEKEEVSFDDLPQEHAKKMLGYSKISNCCSLARSDGYKYVWIDTCCIDKRSSAELSEAINSMYAWYQDAQKCYAYLADVLPDENPHGENSSFRKSRWFTRGWTLQELLAPSTVEFYGQNWHEIGTQVSLRDVLCEITTIDEEILLCGNFETASVAKKMSWASKRTTTRIEDIAYSLFGIFGVNMPTLYGEGRHAFTRLQHMIIQSSNDHTIFTWMGNGYDKQLLAYDPTCFTDCGNIHSANHGSKSPFSITNAGLRIELPLLKCCSPGSGDNEYIAILDCYVQSLSDRLGIYVEKYGDRFFRIKSDAVVFDIDRSRGAVPEVLYIKDRPFLDAQPALKIQPYNIYGIYCDFSLQLASPGIRDFTYRKSYFDVLFVHHVDRDQSGRLRLGFEYRNTCSGFFIFENSAAEKFIVIVGVRNDKAWCEVVTSISEAAALTEFLEHDPGPFLSRFMSQASASSGFRWGKEGGMLLRSDRASDLLPEQGVVSVAVRSVVGSHPSNPSQCAAYAIYVSIKDDVKTLSPKRVPTSLEPIQGVFGVIFGKTFGGEIVKRHFLPSVSWQESKNGSMVLRSRPINQTFGCFYFIPRRYIALTKKRRTEPVIVVLGIYENKGWTDILNMTEVVSWSMSESGYYVPLANTLEKVSALYDLSGKRRSIPRQHFAVNYKPLSTNKGSVKVEMKRSKHLNQGIFQVEVSYTLDPKDEGQNVSDPDGLRIPESTPSTQAQSLRANQKMSVEGEVLRREDFYLVPKHPYDSSTPRHGLNNPVLKRFGKSHPRNNGKRTRHSSYSESR